MGKLIFVSNRLPYHIAKTENGYESRISVSGLVTGVLSVFEEHEGIWIGWSGESKEVCEENLDILKSWESENYFSVPIPDNVLTEAHENFNNRSLWSLFHYFIDFVDFKRNEWDAYVEYNKLFAKTILEHYSEGDTVFVNDFQLMLVPKLLRQEKQNINVRYFHHITFPTSDIFERLPVAKELLEGILGADYIGFHTENHVKSFWRSCNRVGLKIDPNVKTIEANPVGVDIEYWKNLVENPYTKINSNWIKSCFNGRKLILATERLDYTKGIKERIRAYQYLLETYPELQGHVTMIQVAVHSRLGTPIYDTIGREVDEAVGRLNGKYKRFDWRPIYYTNQSFTQEELASLYMASDVGCVTPLIDGLNLVSKEYVLSGDNNRALVLSKFAGVADELKDAYIVNPYDAEEVGEAMYKALYEPNVEKLKPIVEANTIQRWAKQVLWN
jgi:trehalose 6-phosphate synthase/phosphatase